MPGSLLTEPLDSAKKASPVISTVSSSCSSVVSSARSRDFSSFVNSPAFSSFANSLAFSPIYNY